MWGMQVLQEHSPATMSAIHGGHTWSLAAFAALGFGLFDERGSGTRIDF
jgi:hypothetical protein